MSRDAELIAGMIGGESGAFEAVYRQYRVRLFQYALSLLRSQMEAEDVVHDVFVGLAKQATAGRVPRELSPYLYAAIRNRSIDRMRRKPGLSLDDVDVDLIAALPGDEERIALRRLLNRALVELPAEQREVVVLRTWHDLAFSTIAEMQGTSVNTALSRYQYGLSKLRKELGAHER